MLNNFLTLKKIKFQTKNKKNYLFYFLTIKLFSQMK